MMTCNEWDRVIEDGEIIARCKHCYATIAGCCRVKHRYGCPIAGESPKRRRS